MLRVRVWTRGKPKAIRMSSPSPFTAVIATTCMVGTAVTGLPPVPAQLLSTLPVPQPRAGISWHDAICMDGVKLLVDQVAGGCGGPVHVLLLSGGAPSIVQVPWYLHCGSDGFDFAGLVPSPYILGSRGRFLGAIHLRTKTPCQNRRGEEGAESDVGAESDPI